MSKAYFSKLCLGTAQFGLDYGIANKRGRVDRDEVHEILEYAYAQGIHTLDTAYAYGASERVIGEFVEKQGSPFEIISKLPPLEVRSRGISEEIEDLLHASLQRLKIQYLYGYLLHSFEDFRNYREAWEVLKGLKRKGSVLKVGFSLYHPKDLNVLLQEDIKFDIVQVPYSIFDRRFESFFKVLTDKKIEIYARSVFLQGLAFMPFDELPDYLIGAREYLIGLNEIARRNEVSINAVCLNTVLKNPYVTKVIIGVDGLSHLRANLDSMCFLERVANLSDELEDLRIDDEDILLPYRWSKV